MIKIILYLLFFIFLTGCAARDEVKNNLSYENSERLYQLGKKHDLNRSYFKAARLYKRAAVLGHSGAQNSLGVLYSKSKGVKHDRAKAIKWYRKSAEQNNADAQYHLGRVYDSGYGVKIDYTKAMSWYLKAAKQNHPKALNNIGWLYASGSGVPKNLKKADSYYRRAARLGNQTARNNIKSLNYTQTSNKSELIDRNKMDEFSNEVLNKYIISGKYITNETQSVVFNASLNWANRLYKWKSDKLFKKANMEAKNNRPSNMNYCSSLSNVLSNNISLQPSLNKAHKEEAEKYFQRVSGYEQAGLIKYKVSPAKLGLIQEHQFLWNRPAICSCVINSEITQLCKRYDYQPL